MKTCQPNRRCGLGFNSANGNRTGVLSDALGWCPRPGRTGRIVGSWGWIPHLSAGVRSGRKALSYIGLAQGSTPPPLLKPQLLSVGAFSRLLATVPACLCGFMRTPADFAGCLSGPLSAAFRSLLAILLPGFALREWPGVRKGTVQHPFKSTGYARTVQAVGSRHCLPGEELPRPGGCPFRPYRLGSTAAAR